MSQVSQRAETARLFRFSTAEFAPRDRTALLREEYGARMMRLDMEPLSDAPLEATITFQAFDGLGIARVRTTALRVGRTPALLTDGDDAITFQIAARQGLAHQFGREAETCAGDGIALSNADAGDFTYTGPMAHMCLRLERRRLVPMLRLGEDCFAKPIPRDLPALCLLTQYVEALDTVDMAAWPAEQDVVARHISDLVALALGATRDAMAAAQSDSVASAVLHAIKRDIGRRLPRGSARLEAVAAKAGVSPRYVQKLFERAGTTFTHYVQGVRLEQARAMLTNPAHQDTKIAAIAYDCGFDDAGYFARLFLRQFGYSPTDARHDLPRRRASD